MELNIVIALDNDAFENPEEVGRILENLKEKLNDGSFFHVSNNPTRWPIRDINGNTVGSFWVSGEPEGQED